MTVADPKNEQIKKVQIADVEESQIGPKGSELDDSQLDTVAGGDGYTIQGVDPTSNI